MWQTANDTWSVESPFRYKAPGRRMPIQRKPAMFANGIPVGNRNINYPWLDMEANACNLGRLGQDWCL